MASSSNTNSYSRPPLPSPTLPVDFPERLQALHNQELVAYKTEDYIEFSKQLMDHCHQSRNSDTETKFEEVSSHPSALQEHWREVIGEWVYNLIDHFECPREVVSICMNYIDRCTYRLLQERGSVSKQQYQLVAVTCLYMAVKMACPKLLTPESMVYLSRDVFTAQQITAMELEVLDKLNYQLHPPTSYVFLRHYMLLLQHGENNNSSFAADKVRVVRTLEAARFSLELSVLDYYFILHRPSHVALAALLNALEEERIPLSSQLASELLVSSSVQGDDDIEIIRFCQKRLRRIHSDLVDEDQDQTSDDEGSVAYILDDLQTDENGRLVSPVTVAVHRI